jgi:hypothetical protein
MLISSEQRMLCHTVKYFLFVRNQFSWILWLNQSIILRIQQTVNFFNPFMGKQLTNNTFFSSKTLKLFDFPMFWLWAYLMAIPAMCTKLNIYVFNFFTITIQRNLSKANLLGTNFYVRNRQVFGLYR